MESGGRSPPGCGSAGSPADAGPASYPRAAPDGKPCPSLALDQSLEELRVTKEALDEEAEARRQADKRAEQAEAQNRDMAVEIERLRALLDDRDPG